MSTQNSVICVSRRRSLVAALVFLAVVAVAATPATASIIYTLNTTFNGVPPTSTPPWLTADFTTVSTGTVNLTLTSSLSVASEFFSDVTFNVDPSIVPSSLTIVQSPAVNPLATSMPHTTQNTQSVTGGGAAGTGFDIKINWGTAGPPTNVGRFNGTDVVSFTITGAGLTESDFAYTNTGSAAAHVAAHVQGIPAAVGTTSGAIKDGFGAPPPVPEPSTVIIWSLLGALAVTVGWWRRRKAA